VALRIKSTWFRRDEDRLSESGLKENGEALAFICWRLALDKAINLHGVDFIYDNDTQRVGIIGEYLSLLITVADRHVHERLEDKDRGIFINSLAKRLADHMQDNCVDIFGSGDYKGPFISMLNMRSIGYSECSYSKEDGASYNMMHYFGSHTLKVMGEAHHDNRWVIDQAMEIDGPEIIEKMLSALDNLFD